MPRPSARSETVTFAPPVASPLASIEVSLLALLVAIEGLPAGSPAGKAYRSAIQRKGWELTGIGGAEAMEYALVRARQDAPDRAAAREAIITAAWTGIPGWRT